MSGFYSEEYKHLVAAQRAMSDMLHDTSAKASERAQCARALVDIVQMKRFMRGAANPKPVDMGLPAKLSRKSKAHADTPTFEDPTTPSVTSG